MKEFDQVRVINDRDEYAEAGIYKGMVGYIMDPRRIEGCWLVIVSGEFHQAPNGVWYCDDKECGIHEDDLEIVKEA